MSGWTALDALLDDAPGAWGACVCRLDGTPLWMYRAEALRSAASLIKVPLALAVYEELPDALDEVIELREADRVDGDGSFDRAPIGTRRSLRELIGHALTESDNTAANLVIERIGMERVNAWLARQGRASRLQRRFMDLAALEAGRDNLTSPLEMCRLLCRLPEGRFAEPLAMLRRSVADGKLAAGLPLGTAIAHKVGDLHGVEHDAGLVWGPEQPYCIAVMSNAVPDVAAARRTIAELSREVWMLLQASPALLDTKGS